jgi:arylsulfatase A-like enzyme
MSLILRVACVFLGVCLAACGRRDRPPNVIVILVDTLRADRLGAYGSTANLTPFLDELAARGTVFRHAVAPSPWTNPSVASLFTSLPQAQHGVTAFSSPLPADAVTLAEALHERGYRTAAFVANGMLLPAQGFKRGFEHYMLYWTTPKDAYVKRRAGMITPDILRWLDQQPAEPAQAVFLYLHYMETHNPYSPPADVLAELYPGDVPDVEAATTAAFFKSRDPAEVATVERVYNAELRALDRDLRALFAELEGRGVLDDAVVVLTADHGEQFLEHGQLGHAHSLYHEEIDIPLFLVRTRRRDARVVREPVSLIDVAPTLIDLAGGTAPATFEGRSLRALAEGTVAAESVPVYSELVFGSETADDPDAPRRVHRIAVVEGDHKLIQHKDGVQEFYDLADDPGERRPDALSPDARAALQDILATSPPMRALAARGTVFAPPVSAETAARMRALGYAR